MGTHLKNPRNWEEIQIELEELKAAADQLRQNKNTQPTENRTTQPEVDNTTVGLNIDLVQALNIADGSVRHRTYHPGTN